MFRQFVKGIIIILLFGVVAPFFIAHPNGQGNIMTIKSFISLDPEVYKARYTVALVEINRFFSKGVDTVVDSDQGTTKLYKWQDQNGEWHYGDHPDSQAESELVEIDPNKNIVEFKDISSTLGKTLADDEPKIRHEHGKRDGSGNFLGGYTRALEKANDVQGTVDGYSDKTKKASGQ